LLLTKVARVNQPRRRADAARNDELILDAGVDLLREKGPDRITALDLARAAGLTTGAVYARYENNEEILVGLWQNRVSRAMKSFFETAIGVLEPGQSRADSQAHIAMSLANPAGLLKPAISLMIAAPRVPELAEVVIPDVQAWLAGIGVDAAPRDADSDRRLAVIGFVVGCLYYSAIDLFDPAEWEAIKPAAHAVIDSRKSPKWPPAREVPLAHSMISTDNPVRDALVNGAARVIARSGVERATTQRIARAADLPPSALFAEYRTRQSLFEDVATKLLNNLYRGARAGNYIDASQAVPDVGPAVTLDDPRLEMYQEVLKHQAMSANYTLLSPAGRELRRLRLEFHLAAIHDPMARSALVQADLDASVFAAQLFGRHYGLPGEILVPGSHMLRMLAQGLMLIEDCSGLAYGMDVRLIFEPLYEFIIDEALRVNNGG